VARDRRATLLDLLVTADVELNKVDELGDWPLREAARSGWVSAVDRLIKSGADPNTRDREGRSVLYFLRLAESGNGDDRLRKLTPEHFEVVRKLGRAGYDFSNADQSGRSLIDTFLQTPVDFALLDVLA
jgi:ankyrin repeat protein